MGREFESRQGKCKVVAFKNAVYNYNAGVVVENSEPNPTITI
jgi:hypothetical protein